MTLTGGFPVLPATPTFSAVDPVIPASVTWGVTADGELIIQGEEFVEGATITIGDEAGEVEEHFAND